jgi:hypothetical protein
MRKFCHVNVRNLDNVSDDFGYPCFYGRVTQRTMDLDLPYRGFAIVFSIPRVPGTQGQGLAPACHHLLKIHKYII